MSEPYYCNECKKNHVRGKIYEDHKEFAAKKDAVPEKEVENEKQVVSTAIIVDMPNGDVVGATPSKGRIVKVIITEPKDDDNYFTPKRLDQFLLVAKKNQLRVLLEGCRVKFADEIYIAVWRVASWEKEVGHGRKPFTIDEAIKYGPLIDMANGKKPGILRRARSKKMLKEAAA
jgi:hypothetical protein